MRRDPCACARAGLERVLRRDGGPAFRSSPAGTRDSAQQNLFKRLYNGVMARGDCVVAISDQIAELVVERYKTPWDRITVIPASIDFERFDPARVSPERIDAVRSAWGVQPDTKVILVVGRMLRRKGHHVVVDAVRRLKEMGLKDFMCVFVGEDQGKSRYSGELWDLVLATGTTEVIRMAGPTDDLPAAFAAATVVVNAAIQPEGLQRAILEAEAMARPVVVSDLGAGPDAVLAPPAVAEDRMTGLRFSAGDSVALAAALVRLFSLPPAGTGRDRRARARLGAGEFQHRGRRRADASALRARSRRAGGLERPGTATHLSARRYPARVARTRATFVIQTANSGRNPVDLGAVCPDPSPTRFGGSGATA